MTTEEEVVIEEPPPDTQDGSESNSTCMICMEEWTIGSEHRVCCLKCGHMFGRSCIERWIREKGSNAKCPSCNKAAKKPDLRDLWCRTLRATDNTELSNLQQMLENERALRRSDSAVIFQKNLRIDMLQADLEKLKRNLIEKDAKLVKLEGVLNRLRLRQQQPAANNEENSMESMLSTIVDDEYVSLDVDVEPRELKGMFHFAEKVESSATGGCRSFALCPTSSIILVAQPAPTGTRNIFGGFGLRKYSTFDTNIREFIPLHSKIITSMQLKPIGDLILTSSQDRRVRLTSISNNTCIQSYQCDNEPTCVSWSAHRDQQFYVGSGNCYVTLYDIRNTSEYIYQTERRVASTRLFSIAATTGPDGLHGLIVNDHKGSQFLEVSETSDYELETIDRTSEHLTSHQLPFEGLMGTVDFSKQMDMALISTRRSPTSANSSHNLVKLKKVRQEDGSTNIECKRVRTFLGGRPGELLNQSRILKHPTMSDSVLVCACDQDARGIRLWDSSDNTEYQTIRTDLFIRDVIMYSPENSNQHILYTLSENGLSIYRWDYA